LTVSVCKSALLNQSELRNKIITTVRVVVAITPRRSNAPAAIVLHRRNHQKLLDPYRGNEGYKGNVRFDPIVGIVRFDPIVGIVRFDPIVGIVRLTNH
jgi:hypothetical protein